MLLSKIFISISALIGCGIGLLVSYLSGIEPAEDLALSDLSESAQQWFARGKMYNILGQQMFAIVEGQGEETLILIHGFPTSSYDYHRALPHLLKKFRVVMFDHVGFGFSSKPSNYTYSLVDQSEQALALWRTLGITKAHIVAHDMGDSVLTEILSRRDRSSLPDYFTNFFQSIGFTNGGMRYDLINFRLSQTLLLSSLGPYLSQLQTKLPSLERFARQQLGSIWGKFTENMDEDITNIIDINKYKGGNKITHKTVTYLRDRARFEPRWLSSLSRLDIPALVFWGDSDAVAPMTIPRSLSTILPHQHLVGRTLQDTGHFLMLERPEQWAKTISQFILNINK